MAKIVNIKARQILDSRGIPTVEVDVILEGGFSGRASVPSGASTGKYEALELRDDNSFDKKSRLKYFGKGVEKAVKNIQEKISHALISMDGENQFAIDDKMIHLDDTLDKSNLGANAILAVSLAVARASANSFKMPLFKYLGGKNARILPVPMMNIINGGSHSDSPIDIQEFMIVPSGFERFSDALRAGSEIFHKLKEILRKKNLSTAIGDEGGFAPNLSGEKEALDLICQAVEKAKYKLEDEVSIAIDVASSEFYDEQKSLYIFKKSTKESLTSSQMIDYLINLRENYPILSIEDGLAQEDWKAWKILTKKMSDKKDTLLVGDDLFATNKKFILKAIKEKVANAVLIKPNQIGSLSETLESIDIAKKACYKCIVSHRSGDTNDTFISSLAVASSVGRIKTGSLSRGERIEKYNELLRIEEILGKNAIYAGNM